MLDISGSQIEYSTAQKGGDIYANGGSLKLTDTVVTRNEGAGIYGGSAGLTLINSTITRNTSQNGTGGGLLINKFSTNLITIINGVISGNFAGMTGGGIQHFQGELSLINTLVS